MSTSHLDLQGPGLLIAIEGIDGAGKSTQLQALKEKFEAEGLCVCATREPTNGPHGRRLRDSAQQGRLSPEDEVEYFLLDRAQHVKEVIRPRVQAGEVILTDRYYFSSIAYQSARGLSPQDIQERNEAIAPRPHLLIVLELPVEFALSRIRRGRGETPDLFESEKILSHCHRIFHAFGEDLSYARVFDAGLPQEVLTEKIWSWINAGLSLELQILRDLRV